MKDNFDKGIVILDRIILISLLLWLSNGERVGKWINELLIQVK